MRTRPAFALVLVIALLLTGCRAKTPTTATPTPAAPASGETRTQGASTASGEVAATGAQPTPAAPLGLAFDLSAGAEQAAARPDALPRPAASELDAAAQQAVLARLEGLPAAGDDMQAFKFPAQTLPVPRPGVTIQQPLGAAGSTPSAETPAGPLTVLRYAPEGAVELAPNLNITFDQPMVALTGLGDLAEARPPVILEPQPAGQWRWVGTKTLVFEPNAATGHAAGRLPMATKYSVTIPAGTKSATGGSLAQAVRFSFTTPPPQVIRMHPGGDSTPPEPLIFLAFDQRIDPAAVLETIKLTADGKAVTLRLATEAEIAADETVKRLAEGAQTGYWLALRTRAALPLDAGITVQVGPGVPSAEGPLTSTAERRFTFRTYAPLKIVESRCGWDGECPPFAAWNIEFNNALDPESVSDASVTITPALPGADIAVHGTTLQIRGRSAGRTTYTVKLAASIRDQFGQTLGRAETARFRVGSAKPNLYAPGEQLIVLDPAAKPTYSVFTINHERLQIKVYAVTPDDWPAFLAYQQNYYRDTAAPTPPGKLTLSKTIQTHARPDELTETAIDLAPALTEGLGHLIVTVEGEVGTLAKLLPGQQNPQRVYAWVQATRIGLDAFVSPDTLLAWANDLTDGRALADVQLELWPMQVRGRTAADGTAALTLPASKGGQLLIARRGADVALLPASQYFWTDEGWKQRPVGDQVAWYVFNDRGLYRPGEETHVKGWIRRVSMTPRGDILEPSGGPSAISYQLFDSQGNPLASGNADVGALGGFDLTLSLPETMNLGDARLELDRMYTHVITVQEFRRPEFEVTTEASAGPHFVGAGADLTVTAAYYAGGALPNADVSWQVHSQKTTYNPPGWDGFTFGEWTPWWRAIAWDAEPRTFGAVDSGQQFTGTTDAAGMHRLHIDFRTVNPPQPTLLTAEATVMDVNRQAWTSAQNLVVHPADRYVGLRTERYFVEREEPLPVDLIVTDLDGAAVAGVTIEFSAERLGWRQKAGSWHEEAVATQRCTVISGPEPVRCVVETPEGGTYRITATILDALGRANRSVITRWVSGGERIPQREVTQEEITLVPDKQEYAAGDVAEILVQAPFYPAEGLLTLRRSGLLRSERFAMAGPSLTLRVPIEDAFTPNVYVQVDLVGAAERAGDAGSGDAAVPPRPAYAKGELNLKVPPLTRALTVAAVPVAEKLAPGESVAVTVEVRDAHGAIVPEAEVALVVVDEAILALTNYEVADPLAVFYGERWGDMTDHHNRAAIVLADPAQFGGAADSASLATATAGSRQVVAVEKVAAEKAVEVAAAPMPAAMAAAPQDATTQAAPIAIRSDFDPLAHWTPAGRTDRQGRLVATVTVPDNLTRYRVIAVAVAGGKQFGKAESAITARLPLMVRPSAPRFLNFGDRFELPVVLQNQTDADMTVDVAVDASNLALTEGAGRRVTVPANDRVEVRFPATTVSAGVARFQVAAVAGKWADAARIELPVYTPATTEAFAVYGVIDEGAISQPVIAPSGVYTQFGGLEITTSATALQALTDALLDLVRYPFECSEQMASRILGVAALRDVLTAFQAADLPAPAVIEASVAKDVDMLQRLQNTDGGFPIWQRGRDSWPYLTVHVTNALQRAKLKGYVVPEETLARAADYLRTIEQRYPEWYSQETRNSITAYALSVRKLMGDADPTRARRMIDEVGLDKLTPEAIGWLLSVLSDDAESSAQVAAIRRHLLNRVTETAGAAHFVSSYADQGYVLLHSNRRSDGVLLDALIGDQPDSDLIPKLVTGLLGQRKAGKWANTQENSFILLALDRYFNTYEKQTPDFVARIWLDEQYAGEAEFRGRTTDYQQFNLPMATLAQGGDAAQDLVLSKDGPGRLYYRLGLRYAPTDLAIPPYDAGFTVRRVYEAVDDPTDVTQDADGVWHIKAGARVRIRLTMVAPARRYHVALVDPLPAGLEAINPELATTGRLPQDAPGNGQPVPFWRWWRGPWYEHQNLRDQRVEAFASLLWDGVHTFSYVARATTPGEFIAPPAKAEEMYAPESFGRSGVDRVIISD